MGALQQRGMLDQVGFCTLYVLCSWFLIHLFFLIPPDISQKLDSCSNALQTALILSLNIPEFLLDQWWNHESSMLRMLWQLKMPLFWTLAAHLLLWRCFYVDNLECCSQAREKVSTRRCCHLNTKAILSTWVHVQSDHLLFKPAVVIQSGGE